MYEFTAAVNSGIVEHDVQSPELTDDFLQKLLDIALLRHIAVDERCATALLPDRFHSR